MATSPTRKVSRRTVAEATVQRIDRAAREGGMATRPCPAMITKNARHTRRCHRNVLNATLQGHRDLPRQVSRNIVNLRCSWDTPAAASVNVYSFWQRKRPGAEAGPGYRLRL